MRREAGKALYGRTKFVSSYAKCKKNKGLQMCASDFGQLSPTLHTIESDCRPDASRHTSPRDECKKIRVLIADTQRMLREGLCRLFEAEHDLVVVGEAEHAEEAVAETLRSNPDILLLDLALPPNGAFELLQQLSKQGVSAHSLLLSGNCSREQLIHALELGARGIVLKEVGADILMKAIRCVHSGEYWANRESLVNWAISAQTQPKQLKFGLTQRELQVTSAITGGATNREIASRFSISEETVKRHLTNIFNKIGVSNRLELAVHALHHGLGK